jgi:hypothetical protein
MKDVVSKTPVALICVSVFMLGFIFSMNPLFAQETDSSEVIGMHVKRIIICTSVVEREPVGEGKSFPGDIKKIFCFTDIREAGSDTFITHEWYYKDELKATVKLKVAGTQWRTWSSKGIDKNWTGEWRVEIKDANGNLLSRITFIIGEQSPSETIVPKDETKDASSENDDLENKSDDQKN